MSIVEKRKLVSVLPLANTIYKNFRYIAQFPELNHNVDEIVRLLTDKNMLSLLMFIYPMDKNSVVVHRKLIGYLVGEIKKLNDGRIVYYISYMYVGPKYRGKGLGSKLLSYIETRCPTLGIYNVTLTCDKLDSVYQFYHSRGYRIDPRLNRHKRHVVMSKNLKYIKN